MENGILLDRDWYFIEQRLAFYQETVAGDVHTALEPALHRAVNHISQNAFID